MTNRLCVRRERLGEARMSTRVDVWCLLAKEEMD